MEGMQGTRGLSLLYVRVTKPVSNQETTTIANNDVKNSTSTEGFKIGKWCGEQAVVGVVYVVSHGRLQIRRL